MYSNDGDKVNIRVVSRTKEQTILIWNTQPLTAEQRVNYKVTCRLMTSDTWLTFPSVSPAPALVGKFMDGNTDAVAITHNAVLQEDTPFLARITFGLTDLKETSIKVAGKNSAMPYVKPIRTSTGVYAMPIDWPNLNLIDVIYNGQKIKALPVVIVADQSGCSTPVGNFTSDSLTKEKIE